MQPAPSHLRRVLVVDDEPHIGRIVQYRLEQGRYAVSMCHDGLEALDILRRPDPLDLVLLDIMLPQVSGLEVLAQLRRIPHRVDTPVIMLTAKGSEVDREQATALGAADFVIKPFSPKKLLARVDELLDS